MLALKETNSHLHQIRLPFVETRLKLMHVLPMTAPAPAPAPAPTPAPAPALSEVSSGFSWPPAWTWCDLPGPRDLIQNRHLACPAITSGLRCLCTRVSPHSPFQCKMVEWGGLPPNVPPVPISRPTLSWSSSSKPPPAQFCFCIFHKLQPAIHGSLLHASHW